MTTDYDKIRKDNIRKYGEDERHLAIFGRLYTDRSHFVFELLQNAEDAGATKILFCLFDDRLEVTHNGRRFNEQDVRGVCGVGEGTKTEDLTKIGKIGIGFKSVYAYTNSPEVHSDGEAFKIEHYVRPYAVSPKPIGNSWTTLFLFPFNIPTISTEIACKEIGRRLENLNARTLLFLRNIEEIEYRLPNLINGVYLRDEVSRGSGRKVRVIGQKNGKDEDENWLIFERLVSTPEKNGKVRVEVSFKLENENREGIKVERIVKVNESPLIVYFPTEKYTKLGFLIQGPYRTTPPRDNIPIDDKWNETLLRETSILITDVLPMIKELGLLTVSCLEALPIRTVDFPSTSMFFPIAEIVKKIMSEGELLPADDGTYVCASNAKLARGNELRKLLCHEQLSQLLTSSTTLKWLDAGITQNKTPDIHAFLTKSLGIKEVTPEYFAESISEPFLRRQTNEWFIDFYSSLSDQRALWRAPIRGKEPVGILRQKPILRLADGTHVCPFKPDGTTPNAYLPPAEETSFPVVSRFIVADKQARAFLKDLGLSEPNVYDEIIDIILKKYVNYRGWSVSITEHLDDVRKIIRAMKSDSESMKQKVIEEAKIVPFLRATVNLGTPSYKKASDIYYKTDDLQRYFYILSDVWFLSDEYEPLGSDIDELSSFGVSNLPKLSKNNTSPVPAKLKERARDNSETVENYELHGLHEYLTALEAQNDFEKKTKSAIFLLGIISKCYHNNSSMFEAKYSWFYYKESMKKFDSNILKRLKDSKWIPTIYGSVEKAENVTTDQLINEFTQSQDLIKIFGIVERDILGEEKLKRKHASALGVSFENIDFLLNNLGAFERFKAKFEAKKNMLSFQTRR